MRCLAEVRYGPGGSNAFSIRRQQLFQPARIVIQKVACHGVMMLDLCPPRRDVGIAIRQRPDAMQMVRHQHDGVDREGAAQARSVECNAQG